MQLSDFFDPIPEPQAHNIYMPEEDSLKHQIKYGVVGDYCEEVLLNFEVAIIGIQDGKRPSGNKGGEDAGSVIRGNLVGLRSIPKSLRIIDLGNIKGKTINDRYFAICEVLEILSSLGIVVVIVGGGQDYVLPLVKGIVAHQKELAISIIDARLDFNITGSDFSGQTFLTKLAKDYNENIYELNLIGGQKYLIGESQDAKLADLHWECTRLRDIRNENMAAAEPLLRDADLVSFDVGAIQKEYMPYFSNINVNGLTGYDACRLAWYAGVGDSLKVFCLQEYNPKLDKSGKGAMLCAEIIWHLLDGISQNMSGLTMEGVGGCKISVVHLQDFDIDIRFYSNRVNNRWWIEVPWKNGVKMLACDEKEYLLAKNGELPDKWWRFFQNDI
ncbi:arginase family protein [Saccharicrinis sp. GN24d3]|uniref:arginase family protein n=1 Tax=Saccharicrinis sp. GN24d3 TaxID=3458416 RepID=UPI004036AD3B